MVGSIQSAFAALYQHLATIKQGDWIGIEATIALSESAFTVNSGRALAIPVGISNLNGTVSPFAFLEAGPIQNCQSAMDDCKIHPYFSYVDDAENISDFSVKSPLIISGQPNLFRIDSTLQNNRFQALFCNPTCQLLAAHTFSDYPILGGATQQRIKFPYLFIGVEGLGTTIANSKMTSFSSVIVSVPRGKQYAGSQSWLNYCYDSANSATGDSLATLCNDGWIMRMKSQTFIPITMK